MDSQPCCGSILVWAGLIGFHAFKQDPDLATAVELSGASAVTASAAGPALSRRDGAFLVLQDDGCADRDRASLPAHLRGLPYTTAPLLAVRACLVSCTAVVISSQSAGAHGSFVAFPARRAEAGEPRRSAVA